MIEPSLWSIAVALGINNVVAPYTILEDFKIKLENTKAIEMVLNDLEMCESGGRVLALNKYDQKDNSHSYGLFQFGKKTWLSFGQLYGYIGKDIEPAEIENLIYDPEIQRNIARDMIKDGLIFHWKNCGIQLGLI